MKLKEELAFEKIEDWKQDIILQNELVEKNVGGLTAMQSAV